MATQRSLLLACLLAAVGSAMAQTTYSSLPANTLVSLSYVLGRVAIHPIPCNNSAICTIPQVSVPDSDKVIISYGAAEGLEAPANTTMTLKLCYNQASTVDRPWRKPSDTISSDKQCGTTLKSGLAPVGNFTWTPGVNSVPATYYIQALEVCANGSYCGKGKSLGQFTIIPIDSTPGWLTGLVAAFCCVGPITLAAYFVGEQYYKKRK